VYANNVALPAFARRFCSNRSITPARRAHTSNLQQRVYCCEPMLGQTDRQTDGRTPYRFINPALHIICAKCGMPVIAQNIRKLAARKSNNNDLFSNSLSQYCSPGGDTMGLSVPVPSSRTVIEQRVYCCLIECLNIKQL